MDITLILEKIPGPDESTKAKNAWISTGGGAVNYSVACSRYGHKPYLIGITSRLYESLGLLDEIRKNNVMTIGIKIIEEAFPGLATILQVEGEQRRLISYRGVNNLLSPNHIIELLKKIPEPNIIQFSSVSPLIVKETISSLEDKNTLIGYDPGSETPSSAGGIIQLLEYIDILFINKTEATIIFGQNAGERLRELSKDKIIVLKKGPEGAEVFYKGENYMQPSIRVKVVDTTGAGDTFNAVFNSSFLETRDIPESLRKAVVAGALKAMRKGSSSAPNRDEIEEYLEGIKR